ncbi:hypothetical protein OTB20_42230 [Streptomyces sp. H27-H1]|uniref:hypothetical protein n=1 Tax=Streptomyces sp. H27-H1 TaxID=2996461 RepID=UPI0022715B49|nr:hypothetical protein [Streptomyces sp. H27-H1]MCY0932610.1 hypothetical protein [Streptomyces sp. H27-H1]
MRKLLMVLVVAVMAAIGFAEPAQATVNTVDMPFGMAYGNSTTTGTIHFGDGYTASVSGTVHAASGGRSACAYGMNGNVLSNDIRCSSVAYAGGPNTTFGGTLQIPLSGGVVRVYIVMYDENGYALAKEFCTRIGCTRVY